MTYSLAALASVSMARLSGPLLLATCGVVAGLVVLWAGLQLVRQEQEIDEIERRSEMILDQLTEGVVLIDHARNRARLNKAAARILGVTGGTAPYTELRRSFEVRRANGEILSDEEWPSRLASEGKFVHAMELELRRTGQDGVRYVEVTTSPVYDRRGRAAQTLLTYRDVTEARRANVARERLAVIVDTSGDAIISKDCDGIITSWNRGAEKIFGYTAEEVLGRSIRILLPDHLQSQEEEILNRICAGERAEFLETDRRRKDGTIIQVSATVSPIRDLGGHIIGASKIARDITEQRRLERQMRQAQKLEALGQLTGGVAHDFNNLLGVILGNLELLEEAFEGNERALSRIRTIERAASRGSSLTRRMLSFSRRQELSPASTPLHEVVESTVELASRSLGSDIELVSAVRDSVSRVYVDSSVMQNALLNLLVNARDAMPRGGTITMSSQIAELDEFYPAVVAGEVKAGSYACLSISDTGHGMSAEVMERAFEPFFTTKDRDKGTGLGLAMVYHFVRQSQGNVRIYSEPGKGTTVSLYLPLCDPHAAQEVCTPEDEVLALSGGHALVIDDEQDLTDIAVAYLQGLGYSTSTASSSAMALDVVSSRAVDLVLTDLILPGGINGVELMARIRELEPRAQVIYCSGTPSEALAEHHMAQLDGPLLQKPYKRRELVRAIREGQLKQELAGAKP